MTNVCGLDGAKLVAALLPAKKLVLPSLCPPEVRQRPKSRPSPRMSLHFEWRARSQSP